MPRRSRAVFVGTSGLLILLQGFSPASEPTPRPRDAAEGAISPAEVRSHVERLASWEFAGRSGLGGARAALYIADHFHQMGLQPLFETGYFQSILAQAGRSDSEAELGRNVGAWLPGADPERRDECVILSAHYDHFGVQHGYLYPGADDNASGVAMLLEVARQLAQAPEPPRSSVLFVAFDLEERGLWGSRWFAARSPWPLDKVRVFLTADMIGRSLGNMAEDFVFVMGSEHAPSLRSTIAESAGEKELQVGLLGADLIGTRSDYGPFRDRRVPFLFFSTGEHPDYHQPSDTADRVNYEKLARVSRMILRITAQVADEPQAPQWVEQAVPDLEEVKVVHSICGQLLDLEGDEAPSGWRRTFVTNAHTTMGKILDRGTITKGERAWLARVSLVLLATVF
jgi:hypothetical protein